VTPGTEGRCGVPELPRFADLPVRSALACAWGLWGESDLLGALNLITPEGTAAAAAEIQRGAVFPLDMNLSEPEPALFGRPAVEHRITTAPGFGGVQTFSDDLLDNFNTQVSSQWDGFRHVGGAGHGYYNGLPATAHGIQYWSQRGIATRAVVADLGRWREASGRPIRYGEPDVLEAYELVQCLRFQGVSTRPGDVLLIRTGWPAWWRSLPAENRSALAVPPMAYPGLGPGADCAEVLWDLRVSAVASDTPALEVGPASAVLPAFDAPADGDPEQARADRTTLHVRLLVLLGIPIGELFELEALAADCAADGRYTCFLTSAPLQLTGGAASPPNAVAVK
jgi:kynurenine formamidase